MSDLKQLKGRLDQIGGEAKTMAGNLSTFQGRFKRQVSEIQLAIAGTATKTDQSMIETLNQADRQVAAAVAALQQVAGLASRFGASL
jgi:hypothetical protein